MRRISLPDIVVYVATTVLLSLPVWISLKLLIPTDWSLILSLEASEEFFSAQRALIGIFLFGILSIVASFSYELANLPRPLIVNVLRISLSIFLGLYWFNKITYMWTVKTNFVLGLDFAFAIWPILLLINVLAATLVIVFEPWRFMTIANEDAVGVRSRVNAVINTSIRLLSYIIIFGLLAWFSSARYPLNSTTLWISTSIFMLLGSLTIYQILLGTRYAGQS